MAAGEQNDRAARERLEAVLAAYGADPARWPERDRDLASLLKAGHRGLTASLENARGIDRALSRASNVVPPRGAAERLMARAIEGRGTVAAFARPGQAQMQPRGAAVPGQFAALTALAASLALGFYLGASGQGDWLVHPLLAQDSAEYMAAELDVLGETLQLFEDHMEP